LATRVGSTPTTKSTSSAVEPGPRLKRSELRDRALEKPIARNTCDGSSEPDEHADPVDTATPSRSRAIRRDSASTPSKLMFVVLGRRAGRR
jgi:hypothetical protein